MDSSDPHDLDRFVEAQSADYTQALAELRAGAKRSHWMWYVFPQFAGLGRSAMAQRFAVRSLAEAREYLRHPTLGPRLVECARAMLDVQGKSAEEILGSIDAIKLRSSATLFAHVTSAGSVFHRILDRYYGGAPDPRTLELIDASELYGPEEARTG